MSKTLIYTALFGGKDEAPAVENWNQELSSRYDFICVTDNPQLKSDIYKYVCVKAKCSDLAKDSKYYKICGPPTIESYSTAIWHDASIILDCNMLEELETFSRKYALSSFQHGTPCVYQESRQCVTLGKDTPFKVTLQMLVYAFMYRHPLNYGVYENGILVVNVKRFRGSQLQKKWWRHVRLFTRRDQLSLPIVSRITNSTIGILDGGGFKNPYSRYREHLNNDYKTADLVPKLDNPAAKKLALRIIRKIEHLIR